MKKLFNKFYLDKEKDIIVNLYQTSQDELTYILETPNHKKGTLITNLAKICHLETEKNENDMKIIKGKMQAMINEENKEVYIFRLGGIKVANIYNDKIEIKAQIPAISKTLMSQTKKYKLPIGKTFVKTYILKQSKFRTDLHTHMNAILTPDCLIALGIKHQIKYPLYYIKKLNLKMSKKQEEEIIKQRKEVERQFENSQLTGKYLTRKIDDNTFINFADFILNNLENAEKNIEKIRVSLSILKDGQAVFTNLEKCYIYRYVFAKGTPSENKIELTEEIINKIPEKDIKEIVIKMLQDNNPASPYKNNVIRQDKLLWIAREYQKQGIKYVEITDTDLVKLGMPAIKLLEEIHEILPKIEEETGVKIRFLAGIRRIVLTIIKDQITSDKYLRENLCVLKAVSKDPYVVGSDFIGEEINDIEDLKPAIKQIVQDIAYYDKGFTVRIHAGENDSLKDNVEKSIKCVEESLRPGQEMPRIRIGHGLYSKDPNTKEGKALIEKMKQTNTIIEFQLTSNIRLNNLSTLENHPIKRFLKNGVKCVQGTDGNGFYGTNTFDEQLALRNLLGVTDSEFKQMREVEDKLIQENDIYFKEKSERFKKFLNGRSIREAILEQEDKELEKIKDEEGDLRITSTVESEKVLKDKIKELPIDKIPVIIAGGSFNKKGRTTNINEKGEKIIESLVKQLDTQKVYFVIGHKLEGYEKAIVDASKKYQKKFEIDAIIPKMVNEEVKERLEDKEITGVRISTESEELGIYKSFNYEIFERRKAIVIAFDGNSPVSNLVQEAKNGKGKSKIYVNQENEVLNEKVKSLEGYVVPFRLDENVVEKILIDNPELNN
mgnify:FL=1